MGEGGFSSWTRSVRPRRLIANQLAERTSGATAALMVVTETQSAIGLSIGGEITRHGTVLLVLDLARGTGEFWGEAMLGEGGYMEQGTVRVMIVDDHAVVRSGLSAFLMAYDDLEFVGEASGGLEAVRKCPEFRPDVVLMDLVMPEVDGSEATRLIREACAHVQVIALTSYKEEELVQGALKAGAIGYLLKNVAADELANAIRAAYAGRPTLAPEAAEVLIRATTHSGESDPGLTDRELEILQLMVDGLSNPGIAKKLFLSRSTVKFHVSNILMKLGATSRTEAVSMAIHGRLVK